MSKIDFNEKWRFTLDKVKAPHLNETDDSNWSEINTPHDWSVDFPFDEEKGEGCTGYLPGGIGWYRKKFITTEEMKDKEVWIVFDGIYNRSNVYCNGQIIDFYPYGYVPIKINITEYLNNVGEENLISVKVDHSRYADSRWYTGSGIYRKVNMYILPKINIPIWGTYITTPEVSRLKAKVNLEFKISNEGLLNKDINVIAKIYDPNNRVVAVEDKNIYIGQDKITVINNEFKIDNPLLWGIDESNQYRAELSLVMDKEIIQVHNTNFGIRKIKFDADKGFFLNDENIKIKGVCLHHDGGLVGAAVPLDVWKRRLEKLKECGCNAIRTAHNPASEDFLELCDRMGFLVQEEFYDEWTNPKDKRKNYNGSSFDYITQGHNEFFKEYGKKDLHTIMLRDRNHPCIFQWSIGNEVEWTYPKYAELRKYAYTESKGGYYWCEPICTPDSMRELVRNVPKDKYDMADIAKDLSKWTKELDTTRPVIANCVTPIVNYEEGYADALDIHGYSYREYVYRYGHENYPNLPIMGTENVTQYHEWKAILEKDYIPGIFLWTGIEYLGEAAVGEWPKKSSNTGLLDLAGYEDISYYLFRALWNDKPCINMVTQTLDKSLYTLNKDNKLEEKVEDGWKFRRWTWHEMNRHWNYNEGENVVVELYSNCDTVTLYLNDKEIGVEALESFEDYTYKWCIPFEKGTLKAIGKKNGKEIETIICTSEDIKGIKLSVDKVELESSFDSVAHITAELIDGNGNYVRNLEEQIEFELEGPYKLMGVDNGDTESVQTYKSNKVITKEGRALLILQGIEKGEIKVSAKCNCGSSNLVNIAVI